MLKILDKTGDVVGVLKDEDNSPTMEARIKVEKKENSDSEEEKEPEIEKE